MRRTAAAWFRREDYERLRAISDDDGSLPTTFDEWEKDAIDQLARFAEQWITVEKVVLDPDQFAAWCRTAKIQPNQKARARYAIFQLQHEKPGKA